MGESDVEAECVAVATDMPPGRGREVSANDKDRLVSNGFHHDPAHARAGDRITVEAG